MTSRINADFWSCFNLLPTEVQAQPREKYNLWTTDSFHPSLHFKPLFGSVWSVRISQSYRALGRKRDNLIVWFWVGSHADYDELLKRMD